MEVIVYPTSSHVDIGALSHYSQSASSSAPSSCDDGFYDKEFDVSGFVIGDDDCACDGDSIDLEQWIPSNAAMRLGCCLSDCEEEYDDCDYDEDYDCNEDNDGNDEYDCEEEYDVDEKWDENDDCDGDEEYDDCDNSLLSSKHMLHFNSLHSISEMHYLIIISHSLLSNPPSFSLQSHQ